MAGDVTLSRVMIVSEKCHFTATETRQLTELLSDLTRIQMKSAESIFQEQDFVDILEDRKFSRKDKGQRILQLLRKRCCPQLVRAEKIWTDGMRKWERPKDIWIPLTRAMESPRLEDALECSAARRAAGECWIAEHASELKNLLKQIHEIF